MWAGQQKKAGVVAVRIFKPFPRFGDFRSKFHHHARLNILEVTEGGRRVSQAVEEEHKNHRMLCSSMP